jgi:hypothetical protein
LFGGRFVSVHLDHWFGIVPFRWLGSMVSVRSLSRPCVCLEDGLFPFDLGYWFGISLVRWLGSMVSVRSSSRPCVCLKDGLFPFDLGYWIGVPPFRWIVSNPFDPLFQIGLVSVRNNGLNLRSGIPLLFRAVRNTTGLGLVGNSLLEFDGFVPISYRFEL